MRNLAISRLRLVRQINELDSLQAVGQALSSTLDLKTVLYAVYQQVARIMPAETFFVALYDNDTDEVTFPLAVENGEIIQWASQRSGSSLGQQLLRSRSKPGRREQTDVLRRTFGLSRSQKPVTSWLEAPILVGDQLMGMISVQSHSAFNLYDISHEEMLNAIATQAALGIQNAHLYTQTDQALARRVQELDSILNTVREGVLLLDLSYRVAAINRTLADFIGVPANDILGASLAFSRQEPVNNFLKDIGYSPVGLQAECQYILEKANPVKKTTVSLPGPKPLQVERTLAPVRDRWGVVTGWLLVFRDLSEELALQQLRDDMTHMLVHDLRAPLAVLQGSLSSIPDFLNEGNMDHVQRLLDFSQRGVQRLISLVSDILDIARLESGNLPIKPQRVDVRGLLKDIAEQMASLASQGNVEMVISAPEDLPAICVDVGLMNRVLSNLVDNALKFTPVGGRVTLWSSPPPDRSDSLLWLGVSDSGPGIPVEDQQQLFEKFQQLSTPGATRPGSGLGLHYCKLAVEAHGGKIWVESQPDQGSTFVVQLPLAALEI
jgi:signal transduction histidine kinase